MQTANPGFFRFSTVFKILSNLRLWFVIEFEGVEVRIYRYPLFGMLPMNSVIFSFDSTRISPS